MEIMDFLTVFGLLDIPTAIVAVAMLFVGWNFPQPSWAAYIQRKVSEFFSNIKARIKARFAK
jgi:hypothetical protein